MRPKLISFQTRARDAHVVPATPEDVTRLPAPIRSRATQPQLSRVVPAQHMFILRPFRCAVCSEVLPARCPYEEHILS